MTLTDGTCPYFFSHGLILLVCSFSSTSCRAPSWNTHGHYIVTTRTSPTDISVGSNGSIALLKLHNMNRLYQSNIPVKFYCSTSILVLLRHKKSIYSRGAQYVNHNLPVIIKVGWVNRIALKIYLHWNLSLDWHTGQRVWHLNLPDLFKDEYFVRIWRRLIATTLTCCYTLTWDGLVERNSCKDFESSIRRLRSLSV